MKKLLLPLLLLTLPAAIAHAITTSKDIAITVTSVTPTGGNEVFVGPFANWLNVKTTAGCGATGNGSTDDTTAIQNCINMLGTATPVLYFPPGTYKIMTALAVPALSNYTIIGAAPAPTCAANGPPPTTPAAETDTVCIYWGGAANSPTMLQTSDSFSARISRLTFNGNNNAASLLAFSPTTNFSGVELADNVYTGAGGTYNGGVSIDIACGYSIGGSAFGGASNGCAQVVFLRNHFIGGTWGVASGNQNVGDQNFWYSTFTNKVIGINASKGDVQVFRNNFFNSSTADINIPFPQAEQNLDWNYSSGSNQFINCSDGGFYSSYVIEGNVVVHTTSPQAINCFDQGPTIVIDNTFYSSAGTTPIVRKTSLPVSDLFTSGNTFSTISGGVINPSSAQPTSSTCSSASNYAQSNARCNSVGDQTTSASPPGAPTLPGTPPQYCASGCPNTVTVYEETTSRTTLQIQTDINSACPANSTSGSVVHFQAGNYGFGATLTVPGNSFCQIIGDGWNTAMAGGNPVFSCGSACKAVFREFYINGGTYKSTGIKLTGSDQAGGRVFADGLLVQQMQGDGVLVNGLSHTNVELHDGGLVDIGYTAGSIANSVNVVGGIGANAAFVNLFTVDANCVTGADAKTSGNANLTWRHNWHDAGGCTNSGQSVANVTGTGTYSLAGMRAYLWGTPSHYFNITNFSGISAILGLYTAEGLAPADEFISGSVAGSNLSLGYMGCNSPIFTDTATGDAYELLDPQINTPVGCNNGITNGAYVTQTSQNVSNLPAFINTTLAPLRSALPTVPGASGDPALASGVTDTRIYRVKIQAGLIGVDVEP